MSKSIVGISALGTVLALGFSLPGAAAAQESSVEVGMDAGLEYDITDDVNGVETDDVFSVAVPGQHFRVGFFVSDRVSIEPGIGFNFIDQGGGSFTDFTLEGDIAYHFSGDPDETRTFVHGAGAWNLLDFGDGNGTSSDSRFMALAGFGAKLPVDDQMGIRLEANGVRAFESDARLAYWGLQGVIGISFFTR